MTINWRPSPHFSRRMKKITAIILHCDASSTVGATIAWLQDPDSKVSYHYAVGRLGNVYQFVRDTDKAWHAGVSSFDGEPNCNDYSLGLAFSNKNDGELYTPEAIGTMAELCRSLMAQYGIPKERVTTHAKVSPSRKTDPVAPFNLDTFRGLL